jgi:UDP-glucose 4-epimerase
MNQKTVRHALVTGGAGFIGSHLVPALLNQGYQVTVIDNFAGGGKSPRDARALYIQKDVTDFSAIHPHFEGVDVVFHLAALPRVEDSVRHPLRTHDTNVTGVLTVLEAARVHGVRRVVFSSSSAVYGDTELLPTPESEVANPVTPYALHKLCGEGYVRLYSTLYGLSTLALRYFNVYGPHMDPEGPYALVVGRFLALRRAGTPLTITGDGTQTRDFVHVSDVVRANMLGAESELDLKGEVVNIGSGERISILELAETVGGPIEYKDARKETRHTLASIAKAKKLLGWEPTVGIREGLGELKQEWGIHS